MHHLLLDFISVGLKEIEMSYKVHLKLEESQELPLLVDYLFLSYGSMSYFLRDNFRVQRVHILILGGEVHRHNSHEMDLSVLTYDTIVN